MNVLIDTCFWFAYYDGRDDFHQEARKIMGLLEHHRILIPYPTLYETINSRFCRKKEWVAHFSKLIKSPKCVLIQDDPYKEQTLGLSVDASLKNNRAISLVDMIIRQMLADVNLKTDALVTINSCDFEDVCRTRRKVLITDSNMAIVLGK